MIVLYKYMHIGTYVLKLDILGTETPDTFFRIFNCNNNDRLVAYHPCLAMNEKTENIVASLPSYLTVDDLKPRFEH